MGHTNYFEVKGRDNYELGKKLGMLFKKDVIKAVHENQKDNNWQERVERAKKSLEITGKTFPQYIEEIKGYAKGAAVNFLNLWTILVGAELKDITEEKCTSIVTNNGKLVGATEDCFAEVKNELYVLKKTINKLTIIEIYYSYSLGGDSISINSNGVVQMTNTLTHRDSQIGIPRNIIARWLSETDNPKRAFQKLKRSSGYSHTFVEKNGNIRNIELTAKKQVLTQTRASFVHTNHYLTNLRKFQSKNFSSGVSTGSIERFNTGKGKVRHKMTVKEMKELLSDRSNGKELSIFNTRTIGRIIIDLSNFTSYIWLLREPDKGWIKYPLDFIK